MSGWRMLVVLNLISHMREQVIYSSENQVWSSRSKDFWLSTPPLTPAKYGSVPFVVVGGIPLWSVPGYTVSNLNKRNPQYLYATNFTPLAPPPTKPGHCPWLWALSCGAQNTPLYPPPSFLAHCLCPVSDCRIGLATSVRVPCPLSPGSPPPQSPRSFPLRVAAPSVISLTIPPPGRPWTVEAPKRGPILKWSHTGPPCGPPSPPGTSPPLFQIRPRCHVPLFCWGRNAVTTDWMKPSHMKLPVLTPKHLIHWPDLWVSRSNSDPKSIVCCFISYP